MVDFNKLLEETRNLSPQERARRQAERDAGWEARAKGLITDRQAQIEKAARLQGLNVDEKRFITSLQLRAQREDPLTGHAGGELLALSDPQLDWLRRLATREVPRPAPGTRAHRYGRERG